MIYRTDLEGCCTAEVFYEFQFDYQKPNVEEIKRKVVDMAKFSKKDGFATVIVTLTTQQELARKALLELGFICSEPMKKTRHKTRDLYVLYLPLDKFVPPVIAGRAPQPRDAQGRFIKKNPFK